MVTKKLGWIFFALFFAFMASGSERADAPKIKRKLAAPSTRPNIPIEGIEKFIHVPVIDQGTDYTCGVSVLQSILYFYDPMNDFLEMELAKTLRSNWDDGTLTKHMVKFARGLGYSVISRADMTLDEVRSFVDAGKPVIVLLQAWAETPVDWRTDWKDGHFAIIIGYDNDHIYFMDPSVTGNYAYIPIPEFLDRWHDVDGKKRLHHYGMVVTKGRVHFNRDEAVPMD